MVLAMLILPQLDRKQVMVMLLRQNLAVMDRLNACVVVGLVNLSINRRGHTFMMMRLYGLMDHRRCNPFVNSGIMLATLRPERQSQNISSIVQRVHSGEHTRIHPHNSWPGPFRLMDEEFWMVLFKIFEVS